MAKQFKLPDLGEGLHEATLVSWKVREGDHVAADQVLAEVETDKATTELPSPFAGRIVKLHWKPGDSIPVGSVLVSYESDPAPSAGVSPAGRAGVTVEAQRAVKTAARIEAASAEPTAASTDGANGKKRGTADAPARPVLAAPATRKLAREHGIDIANVPGTGPGGRVTPEDVLSYVAAKAGGRAGGVPLPEEAEPPAAGLLSLTRPAMPDFSAFGPVEKQAANAVRRRIAQRMTVSARVTATVTHADEADITSLEENRRLAKPLAEEKGIKLTLLPYVVKAVAAALKHWPLFNASYDEEKQEITIKKYVHIGIAVDGPQGLLVPVLRDADHKSVAELAREIAHLAQKVRDKKIAAEDMRGGTFTITNIGAIGGTFFTPVINWPEVAILGLGRLHDRPALRDNALVHRKILPLCLSFDHRLIDGADAARFVNEVKQFLENPLLLLLES